jgi:hypothetical protein
LACGRSGLLGLLGELRYRRRADAPVLVVGREQQVASRADQALVLGRVMLMIAALFSGVLASAASVLSWKQP